MTSRALPLLLAAATLPPGTAQADLTPASRLTPAGLGPVRIGMSERQAEHAAGIALTSAGTGSGCRYVRPADRSIRAEFMLNNGRVVRIDLTRRGIRTTRDVRVGDPERVVRRRFAGLLRVVPAKYVPGGRDLEVRPASAAQRNRRLIFESNGTRVTYVRAGRLPEVRWVERCG